MPLLHLHDAFRDKKFIASILIGNFIALPALAWTLIQFLPYDPALRLGVLLVLLVPCTDWFISFTQLGNGNVPRAIAVTPINLLLQLILLPAYLWLMLGDSPAIELGFADIWPALLVVSLPLVAAAVTERWIEMSPQRTAVRHRLAWWPIPLLTLVIFMIAGTQVSAVNEMPGLITILMPLFVTFLLLSSLIAKGLAYILALPTEHGRTLAFSLGTRNSFIVLPFALSLPAGWEIVAIVIVVQSLVELFGMAFYLWWIPRRLFK